MTELAPLALMPNKLLQWGVVSRMKVHVVRRDVLGFGYAQGFCFATSGILPPFCPCRLPTRVFLGGGLRGLARFDAPVPIPVLISYFCLVDFLYDKGCSVTALWISCPTKAVAIHLSIRLSAASVFGHMTPLGSSVSIATVATYAACGQACGSV